MCHTITDNLSPAGDDRTPHRLIGTSQGGAQPQTRAAGGTLAFEVASVKRNKSAVTDRELKKFLHDGIRSNRGGRLTITNVPLFMIVAAAYQLSFQSPRLSGGPDWTHSEGYDIDAILPAREQDARMRLMLQNLLADRFKLILRRDMKVLPV